MIYYKSLSQVFDKVPLCSNNHVLLQNLAMNLDDDSRNNTKESPGQKQLFCKYCEAVKKNIQIFKIKKPPKKVVFIFICMDLDFEIYKGKNFAGLCKDIVKNSESKKDQIDILISELRSLIKTVNDAVIIVPLIKDYYDVGVKNDEQLVKLASIVQKLVAKGEASGEGNNMMLSDEERKQLMEDVVSIAKVSK